MSLAIRDTVTPDLKRKAAALKDRKPVLEAMGLELISITVRAFRDSSLRAATWRPKKDGTPATLYKSGELKHSVQRIVELTNDTVTVGSDRPYAASHQLGVQTKPHVIKAKYAGALYWDGAGHPVKAVNHPGSKIPPRPFFPFRPDGTMLPSAREKVEAVGKLKVDKLLGL